MQLGLVSIQRNRGPWLVEWFAFHYLVGFRKFYFYAHLCDDDTHELLLKLASKFDIQSFVMASVQDKVQLAAYQHACDHFMHDVDWMCFLDGDEFIFPTQHLDLASALEEYEAVPISGLGVYNRNFGSSGHIQEPTGLITENYRFRADPNFLPQRRIKSLVKGKQTISIGSNSHLFTTPLGTVDELQRPITWGYMPDYEPSYEKFQINHYVCQSRSYFLEFKKNSGHADASANAVREEIWWDNFNSNAVADHSLTRYCQPLRDFVEKINAELELPNLPPVPFTRPQAHQN
ncbi:glycosyltransferase family 2 protein [Rhodoferax aquaticus]|uniref:Glycosyl transferase n=1 Tax=Rhodoferax aquaticus TaxID=2527691 RepID=A0A515EP88_9BURK|nr:glycosyltransferase family 2 protein [Rhodoferax aquaticus]QDL54435.1 glycosyl transferase [Rhodoferax aquaticus]